MKNVLTHQLCKVIVKSSEEYEEDIRNAYKEANMNNSDINIDANGTIGGTFPYALLAEYYGVTSVTSIHCDNEYGCLWIVYTE